MGEDSDAVEFDTKITDGFIKIPSKYRELSNVENVRLAVVILNA